MGVEFFIDNRSGFTRNHVVKALMLLGKNSISRKTVMKELHLNEASGRTLLRSMEKNGLVAASKNGHYLTDKGKSMLSELSFLILGPFPVEKTSINVSKYNVCYVVRKASAKIGKGLEQRDSAIRSGADGLTTLVMKEKLVIPGMERWSVPAEMQRKFKPLAKRGDVLLIGSAKERIVADVATLGAALDLVE